jgi:hypothetical protein
MQEIEQEYITRRSAGERSERPAPTIEKIERVLSLDPGATIADLNNPKRKLNVQSEDYAFIIQREKMLEKRFKTKKKNYTKYLINETLYQR